MRFKAMLFFTLTALSLQLAFSQSEASSAVPLREGAAAGQMYLVGGFSVAYKKQLSGSTALRYSADISLSFNQDKNDRTNFFNSRFTTGQNSSTEDGTGNAQSISFSPQYVWYLGSVSAVNLFVGVGPQVIYSRSFSKSTYESSSVQPLPSSKTTNESESSMYNLGAGIVGSVGVECFLAGSISVLGQYDAYINHNWGKLTYTNNSRSSTESSPTANTYETKTKAWRLGLGSIRLGISAYF